MHYSNSLDVAKFKKDFLSLCAGKFETDDEKEECLIRLVEKIHNANHSVVAFLRDIDVIEDKKIQMNCRCAAIAQMFNAQLDYRGGSPYVATSAHSSDILFLQFNNSTAVISKYGEIIFGKDEFYLNPRNNYGQGWPIQDITANKYGFITSAGQRILPCVFDVIKQHVGEIIPVYNDGTYDMTIYGSIGELTQTEMQKIIGFVEEEDKEVKELYCVSEDGIVFGLKSSWSQEVSYRRGNIQEIKPVLSDVILSKVKLEALLASK